MINVNDATKIAYRGDSVHKTLTITVPNRNITFTNTDIVSESMELTESIETERSLTFKGCIASQLKFKVAGIVTDLRGEYIEAKIQADNTEEIPLFKGYIDTQDNQTYEDIITEFSCYDILYQKGDIECIDWYETLTFPISIKQFRDSFFNYIGIQQEDTALINDSLQMVKAVSSDSSIKSRYIMQCICQANARYGKIGRDGKFKYIKIEGASSSFGTYPGADTFPSDETFPAKPINTQVIASSMYKSVDYNPYPTDRITKVEVLDEAEIVTGEAGTGTNVFRVAGNMVAYSVNLNTCATNIFNEINDIACTSTRISLVGLPYVECGDLFKYSTRLNMINDYVLSRTLSGIQALNDDYSSDLDQLQSENEPLSNQILKLNGKTNILTRTVDETRSELTEYERQTNGTLSTYSTLISQNAQNITLEAQRASAAEGQLSASIEVNAEAITQKVQKGTVSSEITQEAGQITLSSNRLIVNSTNFKLAADGTLKATNGEFSGTLSSSNGKIGGFTIGAAALYKDKTSLASNTRGVYIGTDGIGISFGIGSSGFKVTSSGMVEINPVTATAMTIGSNLKIYSNGAIEIGNLDINSNGSISIGYGTYSFSVDTQGQNMVIGGRITIDGSSATYGNYMDVTNGWRLKTGSSVHFKVNSSGISLGGSAASYIGFFGSNGSAKKTVGKLSSSATLATVITKVNDLLTALNGYGLITSS